MKKNIKTEKKQQAENTYTELEVYYMDCIDRLDEEHPHWSPQLHNLPGRKRRTAREQILKVYSALRWLHTEPDDIFELNPKEKLKVLTMAPLPYSIRARLC